jgi:putative transposase
MKRERKRYTSEYKAQLALEVVKGQRTLNEIASDSGVHPTQWLQWKKQLLEGLPSVFADKRSKVQQEQAAHEAQLYQEIGQLKVELDWLKKKAGRLSGR